MRLMGPMGLMGLMALDNTAEEGKLLNEIKTNAGIGIKRLHISVGVKNEDYCVKIMAIARKLVILRNGF